MHARNRVEALIGLIYLLRPAKPYTFDKRVFASNRALFDRPTSRRSYVLQTSDREIVLAALSRNSYQIVYHYVDFMTPLARRKHLICARTRRVRSNCRCCVLVKPPLYVYLRILSLSLSRMNEPECRGHT